MSEDYIDFGEICRNKLNMQCQYGMYYIEGFGGYPDVSEGLRFIRNDNWHQIKIHKDDVDEFISRVNKFRGHD